MTALSVEMRAIPCRPDHVQARRVGRDTLVVHLLLKQYHVLNHIAGRIWELADGSRPVDDIAAAIAAEFHIDDDTAREDVTTTIDSLAALRIIELRAVP